MTTVFQKWMVRLDGTVAYKHVVPSSKDNGKNMLVRLNYANFTCSVVRRTVESSF